MAKMSALAIALTAALAYGTAEATVFVVDPTPPACVQPSGGVLVPTIGAAVTAAVAGDRIYVCPGTYPENVVVAPTQSNLTLLGIGRPLVVPGDPTQPGFLILASGVRIQGFAVAGFREAPCAITVGDLFAPLTPPSGVLVLANVVHDNSWGICFFTAGGNEARDNTVESNAVGMADASYGTPVSSNLLLGNRVRRNSVGFSMFGTVSTRVDMNEVSENGTGIRFEAGDGVISRNTVTKNREDGIAANHACCFKMDHNTVRENVKAGINMSTVGMCSVDDNSVARNGEGIHLDDVAYCQLYRNVVQQNDGDGIAAFNLGPEDVFLFNTASGNHGLDCNWDGSDTPTFTANRCLTEVPAGAWD